MFNRLHPLFDDEGAIGAESGVDQTQAAAEETDTSVIESGADNQVAAEPNNFEKAFAKRLAAKEAEWEAKTSEKYKDYELHKEMSEYLSELNGGVDPLTLKERRELEKLEQRAEQANVPPEVMKRIDELEAKAAKGEKLEQDQQESQRVTSYFSAMDKFLEGKGVESKDLNQFMIDNGLSYNPESMDKSFDIAFKAMKSDELESKQSEFEAKKEQFEKDTIKKYLDSKKAPKAEGKGAAGIVGQGAPGSWKAADDRFKARIEAANKSV